MNLLQLCNKFTHRGICTQGWELLVYVNFFHPSPNNVKLSIKSYAAVNHHKHTKCSEVTAGTSIEFAIILINKVM